MAALTPSKCNLHDWSWVHWHGCGRICSAPGTTSLLTLLAVWLLYALPKPAIAMGNDRSALGSDRSQPHAFHGRSISTRTALAGMAFDLYSGALIGLSWGVWKNAARGFALIALGRASAFIVDCLVFWMGCLDGLADRDAMSSGLLLGLDSTCRAAVLSPP